MPSPGEFIAAEGKGATTKRGHKGAAAKSFCGTWQKVLGDVHFTPFCPNRRCYDQPSAKNRRERGHGCGDEHERTRHGGTAWRPQRPQRGQWKRQRKLAADVDLAVAIRPWPSGPKRRFRRFGGAWRLAA